MKILVCGGRNFSNREWMRRLLESLMESHSLTPETTIIVHGAAPGADRMAGFLGKRFGCEVRAYPADWDRYGPSAGPIRNKQMLDEEHPDLVLAFPGGDGTADMCKQARLAGVEVLELLREPVDQSASSCVTVGDGAVRDE